MYLFSLLRQLERVTMGLRLAPQKGAVRQVAISMAPAAWISYSKTLVELQMVKVNRNTAINSNTTS